MILVLRGGDVPEEFWRFCYHGVITNPLLLKHSTIFNAADLGLH